VKLCCQFTHDVGTVVFRRQSFTCFTNTGIMRGTKLRNSITLLNILDKAVQCKVNIPTWIASCYSRRAPAESQPRLPDVGGERCERSERVSLVGLLRRHWQHAGRRKVHQSVRQIRSHREHAELQQIGNYALRSWYGVRCDVVSWVSFVSVFDFVLARIGKYKEEEEDARGKQPYA